MANIIWTGLVLGSVYALVATGFTIAMVPTGVFNFAQGAIVVAGTFFTYQFLSVSGVATGWTLALTTLIGAGAGLLCEVLTVRPLRWARGSVDNAMVTTVGASTAIIGLVGANWGYVPLLVPFHGPSGFLHLLGAVTTPIQIITVGSAIAAALGFEALFRFTRRGQACLAVAEDRDPAMLRGVNVSTLSIAAFSAAGAFGGLAGFIIGPTTYADASLGATLALYGFVAAAFGGQGSFAGGLAGGFVVGIVATFASTYLGANYSDLAVLVLLLVTLGLRPQGLGKGGAHARIV
ncbi:branched-chain amino acid ABC transporter permease [Conexibacter sp. S30A1]|uniref:branched-chain amino acid ABC transporter permease n=1 Tax=Conexibacter sp. S30A1 TaxID=2937800 RepID=UPI00200D7DD5|nr:branched-chain amino acid ABC transporter permease [Conexibacter sp. S30A1]